MWPSCRRWSFPADSKDRTCRGLTWSFGLSKNVRTRLELNQSAKQQAYSSLTCGKRGGRRQRDFLTLTPVDVLGKVADLLDRVEGGAIFYVVRRAQCSELVRRLRLSGEQLTWAFVGVRVAVSASIEEQTARRVDGEVVRGSTTLKRSNDFRSLGNHSRVGTWPLTCIGLADQRGCFDAASECGQNGQHGAKRRCQLHF